eukprot:gene2916-3633_t
MSSLSNNEDKQQQQQQEIVIDVDISKDGDKTIIIDNRNQDIIGTSSTNGSVNLDELHSSSNIHQTNQDDEVHNVLLDGNQNNNNNTGLELNNNQLNNSPSTSESSSSEEELILSSSTIPSSTTKTTTNESFNHHHNNISYIDLIRNQQEKYDFRRSISQKKNNNNNDNSTIEYKYEQIDQIEQELQNQKQQQYLSSNSYNSSITPSKSLKSSTNYYGTTTTSISTPTKNLTTPSSPYTNSILYQSVRHQPQHSPLSTTTTTTSIKTNTSSPYLNKSISPVNSTSSPLRLTDLEKSAHYTRDSKSSPNTTKKLELNKDDSDSDYDSDDEDEINSNSVNSLSKRFNLITSLKPTVEKEVEKDLEIEKLQLKLEREKQSQKDQEISSLLEKLDMVSKSNKWNTIKLIEERIEAERNKPVYIRALTEEEELLIKNALLPRKDELEVLVSYNASDLARKDFRTLGDRQWLNDEVINNYMILLKERQEKNPTKFLKCHFFNTFFYTLLSKNGAGYDYSRVRKWTNTFDIFSFDRVMIPVHRGSHWCLAIINFMDKQIEYYDSLLGESRECLTRLSRYLQDEMTNRSKQGVINLGEFSHVFPKDIPMQQNGYDCGVFMCKFADFSARRNQNLNFTQRDITIYRKFMIVELLNKQILT